MLDGPTYRDVDNPNAALIHTCVEDLDRAVPWLQSDASQEVTTRATIRRRDIYLVETVDRPSSVSAATA